MMRSLSRRIRLATSSTRGSALDRVDRERLLLLVDRLRLLLLPLRRLLLEPLRPPLRLLEPLRLPDPPLRLLEPPRLPDPLLRLLELLLRLLELPPLRLLELRVLRRPPPELDRLPDPDPDPPDPPLLACGMSPPLSVNWNLDGTLHSGSENVR
jgi:hypothetical protein